MTSQHLIIVWSGGFDSTAVLLSAGADAATFDKITVISGDLANANPDCSEQDRTARKNITETLHTIKPFDRYNFTTATEINISEVGEGSGQSETWAFMASEAVSSEDTYTEIRFGYIRHDDFWHFRPNFENAIYNLCEMTGKHKPTIYYPYEWSLKRDILPIYVKYPFIFKEISWGGDTHEVKLKEKDDLKSVFELMLSAADSATAGSVKPSDIIPKSIDISIETSHPPSINSATPTSASLDNTTSSNTIV